MANPLLLQELKAMELLLRRKEGRKLFSMFPDDGPVRRELYPRHCEFFAAGADYRERCFMAANRVGKTVAGAYETALHATGLYPDWWEGRRFDGPISAWVAGKTNETTRDIVQLELFGEVKRTAKGRRWVSGKGMIPADKIDMSSIVWKMGVTDLIDVIKINHVSGGQSTIGLKSYQQGRGSFEGTAKHLVWFDEEPPADCYDEALIRTATTKGICLLTFTPLEGRSDVVNSFMPSEMKVTV